MRRSGFTLVEVLMGVGVVVIIMGVTFALMVSGSRLFSRTVEELRGPDAALVLFEHLESDATQVLQAPGDPRPPMSITSSSQLAFYVPDWPKSNVNTVVAGPVLWELVEEPGGSGRYRPVRNGRRVEGVLLSGWDLELLEPDEEELRLGWFLRVRARFPGQGLLGHEYRAERLLHLPQPSSNFLHFPAHGEELFGENVKMVARPKGERAFEGVGPPDALEVPPPPGGEEAP